MQHRPVIFVVIIPLVVMIVSYSYSSSIFVQGAPVWGTEIDCEIEDEFLELVKCCWEESFPEGYQARVCQTCSEATTPPTCGPVVKESQIGGVPGEEGVLEQPPTPSPFDPSAPLQGGVLEQQEQTPPTSAPGTSPGVLQQQEQGDFAPGFSPGFLRRQEQLPPAEQGAAELPPPATEETQPATVEEEPSTPVCQEGLEFDEDLGFCVPAECPEGQVLDDEAGVCVLEEPEVVEEEPAQSDSEEGQAPEESNSGDGSNN